MTNRLLELSSYVTTTADFQLIRNDGQREAAMRKLLEIDQKIFDLNRIIVAIRLNRLSINDAIGKKSNISILVRSLLDLHQHLKSIFSDGITQQGDRNLARHFFFRMDGYEKKTMQALAQIKDSLDGVFALRDGLLTSLAVHGIRLSSAQRQTIDALKPDVVLAIVKALLAGDRPTRKRINQIMDAARRPGRLVLPPLALPGPGHPTLTVTDLTEN